MLLITVLQNSLHLGVFYLQASPSLLLQQNQVTWRAKMRWKRPRSPVVLWNITNFLFKRFSNITIKAGAGIREASDYLTCTSGKLWRDFIISTVVVSWPTDLKIVLLKRLSFFSQSLSPPHVFLFWLCDTNEITPGLSESRTVWRESDPHIFVIFHAIHLKGVRMAYW